MTDGEVLTGKSARSRTSPSARSSGSERSIVLAAKGGGVTLIGDLFAYGARLLIGILLARLLGADQFGLYTLALSAIAVASGLSGLGLGPALVRFVSMLAGRRDTAGLWGALQVGLGLTTIASLLIGIGFFFLAPSIAEGLLGESRLVPLLRLGSLMIPLVAMGSVLSAATRGFKNMRYTVISQKIAQPTIRLVLIIALALSVGLNVANALVVYIVASAIAFAMLVYFLNRLFALRRPLQAGQRNARGMLRFSLPVYVTRLIKTFRGNIQTLLLGALHEVATVGVFAVASKVNMIGKMFQGSIVRASEPIVSELFDQGKRAQLARFYQTMTKWTFTMNLPMFLILQLFPEAILSVFGREYVGGATALIILAWGSLVDSATGICGVVIDMTGKTGLKLVNVVVVSGLLLGLNLLLIPRWGLVGAAAAGASASALVNLLRVTEVYVLYGLLPYNASFAKPILAGLVALAAGWIASQWFLTQETLAVLAINIAILLAAYAAAIMLLGLDHEDRVVLSRVGRRVRARVWRRTVTS